MTNTNKKFTIKFLNPFTAQVQEKIDWRFWQTKTIEIPEELRQTKEWRPITLEEAYYLIEYFFENDIQEGDSFEKISENDFPADLHKEREKEMTSQWSNIPNEVEQPVTAQINPFIRCIWYKNILETSLVALLLIFSVWMSVKTEVKETEAVENQIEATQEKSKLEIIKEKKDNLNEARTQELQLQKDLRKKREDKKTEKEKEIQRLQEELKIETEFLNAKINSSKKRVWEIDVDIIFYSEEEIKESQNK